MKVEHSHSRQLWRRPRLLTEPNALPVARDARRALFATGRKGKGGNTAGGGIEAPNTLQSKAVVRVLDLLGEGPIGGLLNGAMSIYFNGIPLMNSNGAYNFKGVTWELRFGLPTQDPVAGFPAAEATFTIGQELRHTGPNVFFTITEATATRAAVTVSVPAMYVEDTSNGNINPSSAGVLIQVQPSGGSYATVINDLIAGKCTSTYQKTYTFVLTGTAPWIVQISRTTPDSALATVQNAVYVDAIDVITDYQLIYPDSALIGITFDSLLFGSNLPVRTYDLQALLVSIPSNYNPVARTYTGMWNGSFSTAVTDNPAWCLYDILSAIRYGVGIPASVLEMTAYDLYTIGQYCDVYIPDGFGGTMPRYTCNVSIQNRDEAYTIIQSFLSIFRGLAYWGGGTLRITADMPTPVSKLVTRADVMDGKFTYQGTALKTLHSMAVISFIDPNNQWQPSQEVYQWPASIITVNNGQNIASLAAFGATSRGQAHLMGHWLLDSEQNQSDTVTYRAGTDHMGGLAHLNTMPGSVIELQDPAYQGIRWGGRVKGYLSQAASTGGPVVTWLILDAPCLNANGTVVSISGSTVTNVWLESNGNGNYTTATVSFTATDGGSGAAATATIVDGYITAITVTSPGSGYIGAPDVVISGDGTGAVAFAGLNGTAYAVDLESPGIGIIANIAVIGIGYLSGTMYLILDRVLNPMPDVAAQFVLKSSNTGPRLFRVISVAEPQVGVVEVTALFHDPTKYARVELGLNLGDIDYYSTLNTNAGAPILGPTSVTADDYFVGEGSTTVLRTTVSWVASVDSRVASYDVNAMGDNSYANYWQAVQGPTFDIDNLPIGNYVFGVRGRALNGSVSPWSLSQKFLINGQPTTPPAPLGVNAEGGTRQITLTWDAVPIPNPAYYQINRSAGSSAGPSGGFTPLTQVSATSYTDTDSNFLLPQTWAWYEVAVVTTNQVESPFSAAAGAETTQLLVNDLPVAIQETAAYAQQLLGATPTLVTSLPPSGTVGQYVVLTTTGQLYYWSNGASAAYWKATFQAGTPTPVITLPATVTVGELVVVTSTQQEYIGTAASAPGWLPTSAIIGPDGKITASALEAGSVSAQQIAGNQIYAGHLAANFALFNYEQVGYLVVGDLNFVADAVSSYASVYDGTGATGTGSGTLYTVATLTVSVPIGQDGNPRVRTGVCMVHIDQGSTSGGQPYHVKVTQDGTVLFNRGPLDQYVDLVDIVLPVSVSSSASNTFVVQWGADPGTVCGDATITVLARIS